MRHPIEKSPRDGTAIILEDDASGTYDVAHWSTEAGEWLGENGEPTKITPTHWYPLARDQYLLREDERSRDQSRVGRCAATCSLLDHRNSRCGGAHCHVFPRRGRCLCDAIRRSAKIDISMQSRYDHRAVGEPGFAEERLAAQRQAEADQASAPAEAQQAAQVQQIAAVPVAEAQQSLEGGSSRRLGAGGLRRPDALSRGSMCSCRRKPRTAHDRSNRSGRIWPLPRRRPRLRDKS